MTRMAPPSARHPLTQTEWGGGLRTPEETEVLARGTLPARLAPSPGPSPAPQGRGELSEGDAPLQA
jgi:hypothetical protein